MQFYFPYEENVLGMGTYIPLTIVAKLFILDVGRVGVLATPLGRTS